MMKKSIDKFAVVLDDPQRIYSPGDQVYGTVNLDLKQDVKIPKLSLECKGEAYVSWPANTGTYTRYYYHRQEYFKAKACVYEQEKVTEADISTDSAPYPNKYTFSFRFTIPRKVLPPSYESVHGYIRYSMRAEIQNRKGKSKTKTADTFFTIEDYEEYDEEELENFREDQQKPRNGKETSTLLGRSCYAAGTVTLSAHTDNLLYHGGECINTTVRVEDEGYREAATIDVSLVRVTKYSNLKGDTTHSKDMLVTAVKQLLDKEISTNAVNTQLSVPQGIYPTMQSGCQCINVNYHVEVRLKLSSKSRKAPMVLIPVIIMSSSSLPSQNSTPQNGHPDSDQPESSTNSTTNDSCTDLSCCLVNSGYISDDDVTTQGIDVIVKEDTRL